MAAGTTAVEEAQGAEVTIRNRWVAGIIMEVAVPAEASPAGAVTVMEEEVAAVVPAVTSGVAAEAAISAVVVAGVITDENEMPVRPARNSPRRTRDDQRQLFVRRHSL